MMKSFTSHLRRHVWRFSTLDRAKISVWKYVCWLFLSIIQRITNRHGFDICVHNTSGHAFPFKWYRGFQFVFFLFSFFSATALLPIFCISLMVAIGSRELRLALEYFYSFLRSPTLLFWFFFSKLKSTNKYKWKEFVLCLYFRMYAISIRLVIYLKKKNWKDRILDACSYRQQRIASIALMQLWERVTLLLEISFWPSEEIVSRGLCNHVWLSYDWINFQGAQARQQYIRNGALTIQGYVHYSHGKGRHV